MTQDEINALPKELFNLKAISIKNVKLGSYSDDSENIRIDEPKESHVAECEDVFLSAVHEN